MVSDMSQDWRTGRNTKHTLGGLMRQSTFSRLPGYEDTNDPERLSVDPAMRYVVGGRAKRRHAASTSQMGRSETQVLTQPANLNALMDLSSQWIDRLREPCSEAKRILQGERKPTDENATSEP